MAQAIEQNRQAQLDINRQWEEEQSKRTTLTMEQRGSIGADRKLRDLQANREAEVQTAKELAQQNGLPV